MGENVLRSSRASLAAHKTSLALNPKPRPDNYRVGGGDSRWPPNRHFLTLASYRVIRSHASGRVPNGSNITPAPQEPHACDPAHRPDYACMSVSVIQKYAQSRALPHVSIVAFMYMHVVLRCASQLMDMRKPPHVTGV